MADPDERTVTRPGTVTEACGLLTQQEEAWASLRETLPHGNATAEILRGLLDNAQQDIGAAESELVQLIRDEAEPRRTLALRPSDDAALVGLLPALRAAYQDSETDTPEAARAAWDEAKEALQKNRNNREQLAELANVGSDPLNLATEAAAKREAEITRDANAKCRAILTEARRRILERVMPGTELKAQFFLPLLTDGRYRDIKWKPDDEKVLVFDARKGDYADKKVFSGGAKDQISLALRLAFALATLGGERPNRPGWLFLDEPLSAFDEKRTGALVDLVTAGRLRKQFPQIFLVSHSRSFDPAKFTHRYLISDGTVTTS